MKQPNQTSSALFVPGNRPERFDKAVQTGADVVIVDLEDAVEDSTKPQARAYLQKWLGDNPAQRVVVRVNVAHHPMHTADIAFCAAAPNVRAIMLPKAERTQDILAVAQSGKPIWPLIETPLGLAHLDDIAALPCVERLTYGAMDLALELGLKVPGTTAQRILDQVRYELVLRSALHGLPAPLETVFPDVRDMTGFSKYAQDAKDMGFGGVLAIHPSQVAIANQAFTDTQEQLQWARSILALAKTAHGAFEVDGTMIDAPVIAKAQRLLANTNDGDLR